MTAKTDPPTASQDPRADKRKPRVDKRSGRSLDKSSSWRSELPAELRNASREELAAVMERNLCRDTGLSDLDLANRILGQSILMRTFGEPDGCNLGKPDVEAFGLLREFAPNNIMESMLAAQMSGAHEAALAFLKAAGEPGLSQRQRDGEVAPGEATSTGLQLTVGEHDEAEEPGLGQKRTGRDDASPTPGSAEIRS